MIKVLREQNSPENSNEKTKKPIQGLIPDFEKSLNNNLNVKDAFDNLYEAILETLQ